MKQLYIETYGCQMNFADSEVVASILSDEYRLCQTAQEADVILLNTCSIRENAEQRVLKRLEELRALRKKGKSLKIGLIGCMASRYQDNWVESHLVDFIAGPDSYRFLPEILSDAEAPQIRTELSTDETYSGIIPMRYQTNGISAFVSIMRGCNNFCTYCVVPYTRGRERSRNPEDILQEIRTLCEKGYKEVTLLGQNVNSYLWGGGYGFPQLMADVAKTGHEMRVRFTTSHPKDLSDELLETMAAHPNICKNIHLPAQSGSSEVLKRMNRKYTREDYLERIGSIRRILPEATISTDLISGFCGETPQDHEATLSLMREARFDYAFMFKYSERSGTYAAKHLKDDVPDEVKTARLEEVIALQRELSYESHRRDIGKTFEVLAEGPSKRSDEHFFGRNSQNKVIVFPKEGTQPGQLLNVTVNNCTTATLLGKITR
ncbi:MAG: tRNA (N6-isopentenyl adenosine(37)-C2)-methylthiotransferase MiaB [Bacteroidales bacterium]|jgi:tRNA-2-methylthio-N6-dimethylallyladenosine synthase|nr:tRNA (N6-isopentenyl adenosine(37)-C2)-methylthiotransferase MiaB [Bacteroidales bacterium]